MESQLLQYKHEISILTQQCKKIEGTQKEVESNVLKKNDLHDIEKRLKAIENINTEKRMLQVEKYVEEQIEKPNKNQEQPREAVEGGETTGPTRNPTERQADNDPPPVPCRVENLGLRKSKDAELTPSKWGFQGKTDGAIEVFPLDTNEAKASMEGIPENNNESNTHKAFDSAGNAKTQTNREKEIEEKAKGIKYQNERQNAKRNRSLNLELFQDATPTPPVRFIKRRETEIPPKPKSCAGGTKQQGGIMKKQTKSQSVYNLKRNEEVREDDNPTDDDADVDEMLSQYSGFGAFMGKKEQIKVDMRNE